MIKNLWIKSLLTIIMSIMLTGCLFFDKEIKPIPLFTAKQFNADMYTSKVDNFLILFDASSSMGLEYVGVKKFEIAQEVVFRMNKTLPEMGQTAGLRSFGHSAKVSKNRTELFYGIEKYFSQNLENGFKKITEPGGLSRLDIALNAIPEDFKSLSGNKTAVIIVTDGLDLPSETMAAARKLKASYGSSICFYLIVVGNLPEDAAERKDLAEVLDCGFYTTHDALLTSAGMAGFVEKVFLEKKPTPVAKPVPVVKAVPVVKPKKDSDKDGVYDKDDKCPGTPSGANVNTAGCWTLDHVLFDFDKSDIKSEAYPSLDAVVTILEMNPSMDIILQGHTDNVGTPEYNMELSIRRAHAVKDYLVSKGIDVNKLETEGFGFTKPASLNGTEMGRSMNRRVEIKP